MNPTVSIVVPTYNRPEFLPAALDSIHVQTFTDWELIIADDGSGGSMRECLRSILDPPRARVLCLTHSGRPAVARNAAIREALGEYVAFLDSDDLWLPQKLTSQIDSLRRHPERRWSYTRFALIDAAGRIVDAEPRGSRVAKTGWIREPLLSGEMVIALPTVVVARAMLAESGAFDERLRMCEDDELWFRLASHSEIDAVDEPLTLVRRHTRHSGSDVTAWEDRLSVFETLLRAEPCSARAPLLRRQRAAHAAGLARSQAACGRRVAAFTTLLSSAPHSLRYRSWWPNALRAMARALAPAAMVTIVALFKGRHRARAAR